MPPLPQITAHMASKIEGRRREAMARKRRKQSKPEVETSESEPAEPPEEDVAEGSDDESDRRRSDKLS